MNLKFGENLRKYRLDAGLTQEQLADIFGVSLQSVSRWESSQKASYPDIELLCSIARHFGVSVDTLLGNNDSPNIDWGEYDRMEEPRKKYDFLIEHKKSYPDDHDIDWQLCWVTTDLLDDQTAVDTGVASAKRLLKESKNIRYRSEASAALLRLCPEEELDDYINEYFYGMSYAVYGILNVRYNSRRDYEMLEILRKDHLEHLVEYSFGSDLVVLDSNGDTDTMTEIKRIRIQIKLCDLICDISSCGYEIIGDGEIDLWSVHRARLGLRLAKIYYRIGESDKADKILLELIEFIEKMWNLPEGATLTYRSHFVDGIEAKVEYREYNNKKFVTAVHDSYFYLERGLWFTPKLFWELLDDSVKENPDNEILLSVYQRIKALK
ncbi:MAG: helix-turn-helix transcriptional regulator [Clostridia bacterium]|nr:helix-turn-helix transcriptional regulator [Clostridia bacterium]